MFKNKCLITSVSFGKDKIKIVKKKYGFFGNKRIESKIDINSIGKIQKIYCDNGIVIAIWNKKYNDLLFIIGPENYQNDLAVLYKKFINLDVNIKKEEINFEPFMNEFINDNIIKTVNKESKKKEFKDNNTIFWFTKIIGFILLIIGLIGLINIIEYRIVQKKYELQYVSRIGYNTFYYIKNNESIYVDKIYNIEKEIIKIELDNYEAIELLCDKKSPNECIYLDPSDIINITKPSVNLCFNLIIISIGYVLFSKNRNKDINLQKENIIISSFYILHFTLFIVGILIFSNQILDEYNYLNLKKQSNIINAEIVLGIKGDSYNYRPIANYKVDGRKYIYVSKSYIDGSIYNDIGKKIKIYYDKKNPNVSIESSNPINILSLIGGVLLISLSASKVFKNKLKKININHRKNDEF